LQSGTRFVKRLVLISPLVSGHPDQITGNPEQSNWTTNTLFMELLSDTIVSIELLDGGASLRAVLERVERVRDGPPHRCYRARGSHAPGSGLSSSLSRRLQEDAHTGKGYKRTRGAGGPSFSQSESWQIVGK
jgi:hypothetical protein